MSTLGRNSDGASPAARHRAGQAQSAALRKSWCTGILCILLVAVVWTAATVVKKWVFSGKDGFDDPFFVTGLL